MRQIASIFPSSAIRTLRKGRFSQLTFSARNYYSDAKAREDLMFIPETTGMDVADLDSPSLVSGKDDHLDTSLSDLQSNKQFLNEKTIGDLVDSSIDDTTPLTEAQITHVLGKMRVEFFYDKPSDQDRNLLIREPKSKLTWNSSILFIRRSNEGIAFHGRVVNDSAFEIKTVEFFKFFSEFCQTQQQNQIRLMLGSGYQVLRPEYQKSIIDFLLKDDLDLKITRLLKGLNKLETIKKNMESIYGILKD